MPAAMYLNQVLNDIKKDSAPPKMLHAEHLFKLNEAVFNLPEEDTVDGKLASRLVQTVEKIRTSWNAGTFDDSDSNFTYDYLALLGTMQNQPFFNQQQTEQILDWIREVVTPKSKKQAENSKAKPTKEDSKEKRIHRDDKQKRAYTYNEFRDFGMERDWKDAIPVEEEDQGRRTRRRGKQEAAATSAWEDQGWGKESDWSKPTANAAKASSKGDKQGKADKGKGDKGKGKSAGYEAEPPPLRQKNVKGKGKSKDDDEPSPKGKGKDNGKGKGKDKDSDDAGGKGKGKGKGKVDESPNDKSKSKGKGKGKAKDSDSDSTPKGKGKSGAKGGGKPEKDKGKGKGKWKPK